MNLSVMAFTRQGAQLALRICDILNQLDCHCEAYTTLTPPPQGTFGVPDGLSRWTGQQMAQRDGLIFIGACGIAVRSIAPHLKGKAEDPAVVVLDENGRFAISLLSGHIGGANDLAGVLARAIGVTPVITTATDVAGKWSVDNWAARHGLAILGLDAAKAISAALLRDETVGLFTQYPSQTPLPQGIVPAEDGALGIAITVQKHCKPFAQTLTLVPKAVVLGIGCRKGVSEESIEQAVDASLNTNSIYRQAIAAVYSIDLKAREPGLLAFCREHALPFQTFCAEELASVPGAFTPSSFVAQVTGVDNVCERSALLGSGGKLLFPKECRSGVTVAAAELPYYIEF